MHVIGLTGSIATGKSTVAAMFADWGAKVIDADKQVHQLISPRGQCFRPILKVFGNDLLEDGRINRQQLAAKVFGKPAQLKKLERILHPKVKALRLALVKKYRASGRVPAVVCDIPLLFETHLENEFDCIVVVAAKKELQLKRAVQKFQMTRAQALARHQNQWPLREKIKRADFVIVNNGTKAQLRKQARDVWLQICNPLTKGEVK